MPACLPACSRFMVLLSSLASSLPPALRPRGLHGSRGTWTFPLLDGLPTSGAARRMAGRGSGDAGQLAMGPDGIRLGGLIGAGSFGRVFEGECRLGCDLLCHVL